jgi:hypothetical protein
VTLRPRCVFGVKHIDYPRAAIGAVRTEKKGNPT